MRAGNSSRPAGERKRRSHAFPEGSWAIDPPRPAGPMTPIEKAARFAVRKNTWISKTPTLDARVREQGGSLP